MEDIPSKLISVIFQNLQGFFLETNLRKKTWIIGFSCNPQVSSISHHIDIDLLCTNYENVLLWEISTLKSLIIQ